MNYLLKISLIILLFSCSESQPEFINSNLIDVYHKKHLNHFIDYESKLNSSDITPCCCVSIGESLFPNVYDFSIESPLTYYKIDDSGFSQFTEYFYSAGDSIVRAILHEWDFPIYKATLKQKLRLENPKSEILYSKFISIRKDISEKLGEPVQEIVDKDYYRESYSWNSLNKSKAYLFILGYKNKEFYRLRLITYE